MNKRKTSKTANDAPELDEAWFARAKSAKEVLPRELIAALPKRRPGQRGPGRAPTKVPTTIRVDADVLEGLKASGRGWQTRVNEVLRNWLRSQSGSATTEKTL